MLSNPDSPIIHPAEAKHLDPPSVQQEARKLQQRFDAVPLALGAVGLVALIYLLGSLISPFVIIIAIYLMLTPFREYRAARTMMWTAGLLFVFWFFVTLSGLLVPFILGALVAYLMHPFLTMLETRYNIPRVWSALATILVMIGGLVLLGMWAFPHLAVQTENIVNKLSDFVYNNADNLDYEHLQAMLVSLGLPNDVAKQIVTSQVGPQIKKFFNQIPAIVFGYVQMVPHYLERTVNLLVIFPVSAFYFMKDWGRMGPLFLSYLPARDRERRSKMFTNIDRVLYGFIRGQLLMATIVGVLATISYSIMGVPYAGILGIMVGVTDLIPMIGIVFSGIIIVVVLMLTPPISIPLIIGAILVIFGLHALEAYVIGPKIVGEGIGIPPVVMILSLFIFGYFMGFVGLLIAVPSTAVILLFVEEYRKLQNEEATDVTKPVTSVIQ